jgi:hypothetical protein
MATVDLPCDGSGEYKIKKVKDKITFGTKGKCNFVSFQFVPKDPAPGFSNRQPPQPAGGATISYDYDGSAIPAGGYTFEYKTDQKQQGDGTGVIKNN